MKESLRYVRPNMSLDATHLKSYSKGTLYLATVKTGLNELYTVAIGIQRANEGYDGWNRFLFNLKNDCPLMAWNHLIPAHQKHGFFTFVSDREKGLVQALLENFPINHATQCCIHINQ
jgi:MULE transposase domain